MKGLRQEMPTPVVVYWREAGYGGYTSIAEWKSLRRRQETESMKRDSERFRAGNSAGNSLSLNLDLIAELLNQYGWSARQLCRASGVSESYVGLLLSGRKNADEIKLTTLSRLAQALGVPWESLIVAEGRGDSSVILKVARWSRSDHRELFFEHLDRAHDHLAITRRLDGYLFPNEAMWRWAWTTYEPVPFVEPDEEGKFWRWSEDIVERQRKSRRDSGYRHRVICAREIFGRAVQFDPRFIEDCRKKLGKLFASFTSVHLLPAELNWKAFTDQITQALLPLGILADDWDHISVMDEFLLAIRVKSANYIYCHHPPTVAAVRKLLESSLVPVVRNPGEAQGQTDAYLESLIASS